MGLFGSKVSPELEAYRKKLTSEITAGKNNLKYELRVNRKLIDRRQFRGYVKIYKALTGSKAGFALTEFETLINEASDVINDTLIINFLIEDRNSGDIYFFENLELEPHKSYDLRYFINRELEEFPFLSKSDAIFLAMNKQYTDEQDLQVKMDELAQLKQDIRTGKAGVGQRQ